MNKAKLILRLGLGLVFLYFSLNQIFNPQSWFFLVPNFFKKIFVDVKFLIYFNGFFDLIISFSLFFNKYLKLFSILGFLHLFFLSFYLGFNPSGVRDFGLAIAMLSLYFLNK